MDSEVEIDATNPGEVLACAGIAALAERDDPYARTGFERTNRPNMYRFHYPGSSLSHVKPENDHLEVSDQGGSIRIGDFYLDWWNEDYEYGPQLKLWAGKMTPSSIAWNLAKACSAGTTEDWSALRAQLPADKQGHFEVDPTSCWDGLRMGWSLNVHKHVMPIRPYVELLAFIAIQYFPIPGNKGHAFRYSLWSPVPATLARLVQIGASRHSLSDWKAPVKMAGSYRQLKTAFAIEEDS